MTKNEALRMGMDALVSVLANHKGAPVVPWNDALDGMKAALEAKDEPYGYVWFTKQMEHRFTRMEPNPHMGAMHVTPVYTTTPQRTWVGLTDEEIKEIVGPYGDTPIKGYTRQLFDQIEAKLKEKNSG